jgi:hypothetical protein
MNSINYSIERDTNPDYCKSSAGFPFAKATSRLPPYGNVSSIMPPEKSGTIAANFQYIQ